MDIFATVAANTAAEGLFPEVGPGIRGAGINSSTQQAIVDRGLSPTLRFVHGAEDTYSYYGNRLLGFYHFSEERGIEFDLNIPAGLQNQGLGSKIFRNGLEETGASKFTATWIQSDYYATGSSVNLQRYQAALKNSTAEEAAWKTWSGQQALNCGFRHVSVRQIRNGIEATFTK